MGVNCYTQLVIRPWGDKEFTGEWWEREGWQQCACWWTSGGLGFLTETVFESKIPCFSLGIELKRMWCLEQWQPLGAMKSYSWWWLIASMVKAVLLITSRGSGTWLRSTHHSAAVCEKYQLSIFFEQSESKLQNPNKIKCADKSGKPNL